MEITKSKHPERAEMWGGRAPRISSFLAEFTDSNFTNEVLGSADPVVVDFWAETCAACRVQDVTIERLAESLDGRARVGRMCVYTNPTTPEQFLIKGVPHLMVFRGGEVILELIGTHTFEQLRARLRGVGVS